jgi:hypothetical protein
MQCRGPKCADGERSTKPQEANGIQRDLPVQNAARGFSAKELFFTYFVNRNSCSRKGEGFDSNTFALLLNFMKKVIVFSWLLLCVISSRAQDRYFARTYTTNVLPKGSFDIELWHTSRFGHEGEYFHAMDQRMEYEVGLGGNVQTAFYFNRFQKSLSDSFDHINQTSEIGFSNEWKWKVSKPTSPLGVALYGEVGVKGDELELETKVILDKSFGKNLLAFNAVYEFEGEAERANGENEMEFEETPLEFDLAYMRNFSTSFGAGVELVNHNDIKHGSWENSVFYAGPTINYRGNRWFFIANYLPQLTNVHKTAEFPKSKVLNEHERAEARILIGFSF